MDLKKSGIEYVILEGSSLFACQEQNPDFRSSEWPPWRAQRAVFQGFRLFGT